MPAARRALTQVLAVGHAVHRAQRRQRLRGHNVRLRRGRRRLFLPARSSSRHRLETRSPPAYPGEAPADRDSWIVSPGDGPPLSSTPRRSCRPSRGDVERGHRTPRQCLDASRTDRHLLEPLLVAQLRTSRITLAVICAACRTPPLSPDRRAEERGTVAVSESVEPAATRYHLS